MTSFDFDKFDATRVICLGVVFLGDIGECGRTTEV